MNSKLNTPTSIFCSNDEIFLVDSYNHRVRKILLSGKIVTIAGTGQPGYNGDGIPATSAQLTMPDSVFVSRLNEVYITECGGHRIRKIGTDGRIRTICGIGQPGFSSCGTVANMTRVNAPCGLFVTDENEVYFSDSGNHRVRKIDCHGRVSNVAGTGKSGYSGNVVPAVESQLRYPTGLFLEGKQLYVCDAGNHRVRRIDLPTGLLFDVAGSGHRTFNGDDLQPGFMVNLNYPQRVFVKDGEIYFTDVGNHRVRKIWTDGTVTTIAGGGSQIASVGQPVFSIDACLQHPSAIFMHENVLYITDEHRVLTLDQNGVVMVVAGVLNQSGFEGDVPFNFERHPHIGGSVNRLIRMPTKELLLQKFDRDCVGSSSVVAFMPLLNKKVPVFASKLKFFVESCEKWPFLTDLIDYVMYGKEFEVPKDLEILIQYLSILNCTPRSEFTHLKQLLVTEFIHRVHDENVMQILPLLEDYETEHTTLHFLYLYCLKVIEGDLKAVPNFRMDMYSWTNVKSQMDHLVKTVKVKKHLYTMYNVPSSHPDVKIKMNDGSYIFCHKTVLSSSSAFFCSLFNAEVEYEDLDMENDMTVFIPESGGDGLPYILKSCYGIDIEIEPEHVIQVLELSHLHEMPSLFDKCSTQLEITRENLFQVAELLNFVGVHSEGVSKIRKKIVNFCLVNKICNQHDIVKHLPFAVRVHVLKEWEKYIDGLYKPWQLADLK